MTDLIAPGTTDTSLDLPPDLTIDQWAATGRPLLKASASLWWWLGDWLLYAEHHWATDEHGQEIPVAMAEIRQRASAVAGVELDSLRAARWVARSIPPARRHAPVPWSLHREVAALAPEVADELLADAERKGWSQREMRAAVKAATVLEVDETEDESPGPMRPLRAGFRIIATEADRPVVEKMVADAMSQVERKLARLKITATVEVA